MTEKPTSVTLFERAGLGAAGLDLLQQVLLWRERVAVDGTALAVAFTFIVPLLISGLVLLVSRGRQGWARWLYMALVALTLLAAFRAGVPAWADQTLNVQVALAVGFVSMIASVVAVATVLRPSVSRWLRRRPGRG